MTRAAAHGLHGLCRKRLARNAARHRERGHYPSAIRHLGAGQLNYRLRGFTHRRTGLSRDSEIPELAGMQVRKVSPKRCADLRDVGDHVACRVAAPDELAPSILERAEAIDLLIQRSACRRVSL